MDVNTLALSLGAAWASGINLYATVLVLGYLNLIGAMTLPPDLQVLSNPWVLGAAAVMYGVEFLADKVPGVDSGWDVLHTFIRIPAGAILAAHGVGESGSLGTIAAGLAGGSLAAASHATKAGSRLLINTSPEPFTNWGASLAEDLLVISGLWTALHYPWVFVLLLAIFIGLVIWLLPTLWKALAHLSSKLRRRVKGRGAATPPPSP